MPTRKFEVVDNQIHVPVLILDPRDPERGSREFVAQVDTGAQGTLITTRVIEALGLEPLTSSPLIGIEGQPIMVPEFEVFIGILIPLMRAEDGDPETEMYAHDGDYYRGQVTWAQKWPYDPLDCDVLLGMDLLSGFHITMHDGDFIISN